MNDNETIETVRRRMRINSFMAKDVENIYKDLPDLSRDEFYEIVRGEGDEGYDEDCSEAMCNYYEYLQDIK